MSEMESWGSCASELYTFFFSESKNSMSQLHLKSALSYGWIYYRVSYYNILHNRPNIDRPERCMSLVKVLTSNGASSSSFWTLRKKRYTAPIRKSPSFPFLAFKSA